MTMTPASLLDHNVLRISSARRPRHVAPGHDPRRVELRREETGRRRDRQDRARLSAGEERKSSPRSS